MEKKSQPSGAGNTCLAHKVARNVPCVVAPRPIRILLEPALQNGDTFELEIDYGSKYAPAQKTPEPTAKHTTIDGHVVIEFSNIYDKVPYRLLHKRSGHESSKLLGNITGAQLASSSLPMLGVPSTKREKKSATITDTPPSNKDHLLEQTATDFRKVKSEPWEL